MTKITINKNLITLASKFTKHTKTSNGYNAELSKHIHYCEHDTVITDSCKLLSIPNTLPIISENADSLAVVPIFNWYFYKKYIGKKCSIEVNLDRECYYAMLDHYIIASTVLKPTYPDCSRVLAGYNFDLNITIDDPTSIYSKLTAIQKTIKEFNAQQKLKKLPVYDIENARVVFSYQSGCIQADVVLDDDCNACVANKIKESMRLIDYTLPKSSNVDDTFKVGYKLNYLLDCFEALKHLADNKTFNLNISFDTSKRKFSMIKLSLDSGVWCISAPVIKNDTTTGR